VTVVAEKVRVNAFSVISQAQSELWLITRDFHFDVLRVGLPKGVSQGLASNPVDTAGTTGWRARGAP
jgi:hypothetical protein